VGSGFGGGGATLEAALGFDGGGARPIGGFFGGAPASGCATGAGTTDGPKTGSGAGSAEGAPLAAASVSEGGSARGRVAIHAAMLITAAPATMPAGSQRRFSSGGWMFVTLASGVTGAMGVTGVPAPESLGRET
jgi:hypothetical protein